MVFIKIKKKVRKKKNVKRKAEVLREKGLKHYRKGVYTLAISCFKQSLELNPKENITWNDLGAAYNKIDEYNLAIEACNKAIIEGSEKEDPYTYHHLGYAYYKKREYDKAIEMFKKTLELDSDYDRAAYNMAKAFLKIEKYDDTLKSIEECLKINPDFEDAIELKDRISKKKELDYINNNKTI